MQAVHDAVEEDDISTIVESSDIGISANSCEALARLIDYSPKNDVTFDISFSPVWKDVSFPNQAFQITLTQPHSEACAEAAKRMRTPDVSKFVEVYGLITDLSSTGNPSNLEDVKTPRKIIVQWSSEEFGDIRVAAGVTSSQYLDAISLHREGKPIRLSGTLQKIGRTWSLTPAPPIQ